METDVVADFKSSAPYSDDLSIIRYISEAFPHLHDIRHFIHSYHDPGGYWMFFWRYDAGRVIYIRWEGDALSIRQRLAAGEIEDGIVSPITWNDGKDRIPWNDAGQARLVGNEAHALWHELRKLPKG